MICLTLLNGMKIHLRACHIVEITESECSSFVKLGLHSMAADYEVREKAADICDLMCELEESMI